MPLSGKKFSSNWLMVPVPSLSLPLLAVELSMVQTVAV